MSIKASVVSSLRWTAMAKLGGQVVSWAITLVVIRLLAPGDYGLMAMVNVVIGLLAMVAEMGFGASLVQSATLDRGRVRDLFGVALLLNLLFMGALMAAAPLVAGFYGEPRLTTIMQVACLQFALNGLAVVPDALLRRAMRFRALSLLEIASGITGNLVTLALALAGHGVWSLVIGSLVVALVRALLLQVLHPQRELPRFDWRNARGMVGFGAGVTTTRILSYFSGQADVLVGGRLLGRDALGLYSVALHLATLPMQRVTSIINDVAFAAFAKIQHDVAAVAQNLLLGIRLLALVAFPALWGIAAVAPEIVRLALGERWLDAIVPMQVIALAVPVRMLGTIIATTRLSMGRVDLSMATALAGFLIAPVAFAVAARYGAVGLAVTWALITPMHVMLSAIGSRTALGTRWSALARAAWPSVAAAVVMLGGVELARTATPSWPDAVRLPALVATGAVLYTAATVLINRATMLEAWRLLRPRAATT